MMTDRQVKRLRRALISGKTLAQSADKANMDEKTARKYRDNGRLPGEVVSQRVWRTRSDKFADVWPEVHEQLKDAPGLMAKTLFESLQTKYPGKFDNTLLRSFQRGVKRWRATEGAAKEVFFSQVHPPGRLCASDFTHMTSLQVTIGGQAFEHLVYHFVLTYSNWESITICFSESFESLSEGLQNAVWELGGVPERHRTDRMSLAVNNASSEKEFTGRYAALLGYYKMAMEKIQPREANENGDVEQSHRRFKEGVEQALLMRGRRDFESRESYARFLRDLVRGRNANRRKRFDEELPLLRRLPERRRESCKRETLRVDSGSLIRVDRNTYSVPSRLIGEKVEARLYVEHIEVWYAQKEAERFPRLRGRSKHNVNYRHIIDWLVRKPGAFAHYVYKDDLFPASRFRMAYDALRESHPKRCDQEYLGILYLAARQSETAVDEALRTLLASDQPITQAAVETMVQRADAVAAVTDVIVEQVDLSSFDDLYLHKEVWDGCEGGCDGEADGVLAGVALADASGVF